MRVREGMPFNLRDGGAVDENVLAGLGRHLLHANFNLDELETFKRVVYHRRLVVMLDDFYDMKRAKLAHVKPCT